MTRKTLFGALIAAISSLYSLIGYSQTDPFYEVKGTVVNGVQLKSIELSLLDSKRRAINAIRSDSMGQFTFTGLRSGQYSLVNTFYHIDTTIVLSNHSMDNFVIMLNVCDVDSLQAEQDIKDGKAKLLLIGGIAPIYYRGQEAFEKKYSITYQDYGCTPPNEKCVMDYNNVMFSNLDKKFGRKWRKEVRKDVIGMK